MPGSAGVVSDQGKGVAPPAEGGFALDASGTIRIVQNTTPVVLVPVAGTAIVGECPIAVIDIQEGYFVTPQTVLHLDGSASYSPYGAIVEWSWDVVRAGWLQPDFPALQCLSYPDVSTQCGGSLPVHSGGDG